MTGKELQKQLNESNESDISRVHQYMQMYDRVLLYAMAVNTMSKGMINQTIDLWEKIVKRGINEDVTNRTQFLESTIDGRRAKYEKEPDGEELRLRHLRLYNMAKNVITANMSQRLQDGDEPIS